MFIDWDGAGPGSRLWDLAYAAHGFVPLAAGGDPVRRRTAAAGPGRRLRPGRGQRRALPALIGAHTRGMYDLLTRSAPDRAQPWARLHGEGHAGHWGPAADYIDRHRQAWTRALLD